jgi:hypothetical protein
MIILLREKLINLRKCTLKLPRALEFAAFATMTGGGRIRMKTCIFSPLGAIGDWVPL